VTYTSRIPADPTYLAALGRAHYNFVYLEWIVVSTIVRLRDGDWSEVPQRRPAGHILIALCRSIEQATPPLPNGLRARLRSFSKAFDDCIDVRNKLLHAHPFTADGGAQQVGSPGREWSLDRIHDAAKQFEDAAITGNDIYHGELAAAKG
jgi:hypothetical protein